MRNRRMSTTITVVILIVNTVCISLLYIIASRTMTSIMKDSEMKELQKSLVVETNIIEEYVKHQEDLLITYSNEPVVREYLLDPENEEKRILAQSYTEQYYSRLNNWEGLYIGEWNTHVIAHSNPDIVGMVTRTGEPLKQLQNEMTKGLYNAGMIVSPASQKLILSLYCPVYDSDGKTIIGYVGGGPFAEELEKLLASVENEGASYYMVNALTQMYIFAKDRNLMATQVQDEMLISVMKKLNQSNVALSGEIEYTDEEDGKSIAAYQYMSEHGWIVVSCNSEKNIYADVNRNMRVLGLVCIFSDIIIGLLSWFCIRVSTKPLKHVEESIVRLEHMELEKQHKLDKFIGHESEIGQIATAIDSLYDSIKDMLETEKEKQKALVESEAKGKFLANISHEIRTPINAIVGMDEMILRESDDETIRGYARYIKSSSRMLLGIINDVLDFSKIEAGKMQIVENDYVVSDLFHELAEGIKFQMKEKNLEFEFTIDTSIPSVLKGDEIRIKQILNNLLSNAAKYTEKGKVTFTVEGIWEENEFSLQMSVADTGIGIRKEDMGRLFNSFQRMELEKNRYIQGTGLGLNITKQLVEHMNGKITVTSEYGKGSCFSVCLPQQVIRETTIAEAEHAQENSNDGIQDGGQFLSAPDKCVLIVDDNEMNLIVMEELLKHTKIQMDFASGGNQCIQMTTEKKYDLILMDHMMPEPNGVQTLHLLREDKENLNAETKVVVLTANDVEGAEENYKKEGFAAYLSKPVMPEQLEEILKQFLV